MCCLAKVNNTRKGKSLVNYSKSIRTTVVFFVCLFGFCFCFFFFVCFFFCCFCGGGGLCSPVIKRSRILYWVDSFKTESYGYWLSTMSIGIIIFLSKYWLISWTNSCLNIWRSFSRPMAGVIHWPMVFVRLLLNLFIHQRSEWFVH